MIEVEVKAKINNFKNMKEKLNTIGAKKIKDENQKDIYFNSPIVDFAKTDEALRIRQTKTKNKINTFITYKGSKLNELSKTREEIEMVIEDVEKARNIFKKIGFKEVRTVEKNREYFNYKEFEISLDDVKGLDPYMEIEIVLNDNEDYTIAQKNIFKLFEKLDVTDGFERTSYLELLEKKN